MVKEKKTHRLKENPILPQIVYPVLLYSLASLDCKNISHKVGRAENATERQTETSN